MNTLGFNVPPWAVPCLCLPDLLDPTSGLLPRSSPSQDLLLFQLLCPTAATATVHQPSYICALGLLYKALLRVSRLQLSLRRASVDLRRLICLFSVLTLFIMYLYS